MLLIVLGDALQQGMTQDDYSVTGALLIVGTFAVLQVSVSWVGYRFPRARPVLEGEPIIVLQDGEVVERNLKRERLTIDDITEGARKQGIAHLDDVDYAILETDGTLSFLEKAK
ncbi:MAG TPA: YetF domain-containing protein [Gaiellaceae bacterium]